jgi:hypothetical protein
MSLRSNTLLWQIAAVGYGVGYAKVDGAWRAWASWADSVWEAGHESLDGAVAALWASLGRFDAPSEVEA